MPGDKKPKRTICVNGDGNPIAPPSEVICKECQDRITKTMEDMLAKWPKEAPDAG